MQNVRLLAGLSDFLSAGKTTLLNHILNNRDQRRLLVGRGAEGPLDRR